MPERFMCPKCGVVMKRKSAPVPTATPVQAIARGPTPRIAAPVIAGAPKPAATTIAKPAGFTPKKQLLFLGGFLACLLGGIVIVSIMIFTGDHSKSASGNPNDPNNPNNSSNPDDPTSGPTPPEDKRPKIVKPHIDKGIAYLRKRIADKKDDKVLFWGPDWERGEGLTTGPAGVVALVGLTLLECGLPADHPDIVWLGDVIIEEADKLNKTHSTATALLFLCRWHEGKPLEERHRKLLQSLALRLIAGQLDYGAWWADLPTLKEAQEKQVLKELKDGTFRPSRSGAGTASNTNFAIQSLWMARKHGIPVRETLVAAGGHFQRTQLQNGSWAFSAAVNDRFFASSTCTGLIALAMEKAVLDKDVRPFIPGERIADLTKAFAFVAKSIGPDGEKAMHEEKDTVAGKLFMADSWGDVYFLWAIERLGMIYDKEKIDGKDWYEWGYKELLKAQNPDDGNWEDRHGPIVDTCFALMFLKKSNFTADLTAKLKELK
jgi:hypothetical protein